MNIYDQAKTAIENTEQWTSDITLHKHSKAGNVYITQREGLLTLHWQKDSKRKSVDCGCYNTLTGQWAFTLSQFDYDQWVARIKGKSVVDVIAARYDLSKVLEPRKAPRGASKFAYPESRNWGKRWAR